MIKQLETVCSDFFKRDQRAGYYKKQPLCQTCTSTDQKQIYGPLPLRAESKCYWIMSLLFNSGHWLHNHFAARSIAPQTLKNMSSSMQSSKVKATKIRSNKISPGLIYTLMVREGHHLISDIVIQTFDGWHGWTSRQLPIEPTLLKPHRGHTPMLMRVWWLMGNTHQHPVDPNSRATLVNI